MIKYKGYVGTFEYDADLESFYGSVVNTRDVITFYESSVDDLKREMGTSVDEYLAYCRERGEEPEKPFSGRFLLRIEPDVHRSMATAAVREGKSLNAWAGDALRRAVQST